MATVSGGPETAPASPRRSAPGDRAPADTELVQYEQYIDAQLRKTRLQVKGVELTTSLITLLVGSLAYLFLVALVDHWVVKGGLGFAGRLIFLLGFLAGAGAYFAVVLWPLLVRRINPVYAAQAIERSRPSLKNSLINFLLLRSRPGGLPPMVYDAVERQAADGLSQVSVENAVDRSRLLHVGWALLAIVAVCALYTVVSPKNPLRSFGRVVAPWADIAAPTRVRIADVTPGDERAFHDQFVTVSAEVSGVVSGEQVTLFYSTADGQLVDQAVTMSLPPGGLRYTAELPPSSGGLQQNIEYYLAAGDAVTRRYGIKVLITPSIMVQRVEYEFPRYTEIDASVADRQGDLKGIEGTRVTIHAEANDDIKSAIVDFDCDGRSDVAMQVDGRRATATFTLGLRPKSDEPEHASYQLRFQNAEGEENPRPVRHQIEVIKDLAPQIAFVEPIEAAVKPVQRDAAGPDRDTNKNIGNKNVAQQRGANKNLAGKNVTDRKLPANPIALDPVARETAEPAEQQLPQGGIVRMAVEASDPDFKLDSVKLMAQRNGQPLLSKELLPAAAAGPFQGAFQFDTNSLKLAAGETVVYWAVAEDNKQPEPNRTETPRFTLRITSPEQPRRPQDQVAKADPKQQQPKPNDRRDQKPNDQKDKNDPQEGDQPKQGEPQKGAGKPGEGGPQDGQGAQQQRDEQRRDQQQQEDGQSGEGKQAEGKAGEQKPDDQKNNDQKNPDEKNADQKNSSDESGDSTEGGKAQKGEGKPGEEKSTGGKAGEKQSGQSSQQDQASGEDQRPVDPDAEPGDAIQKILDRRNQEQQKDRGDRPVHQPPDDPTKRDQNPQQQPGDKNSEPSPKKKPVEQKPANQPQGSDAGGDESKGNESKGSEKSPQTGDKSDEPQMPAGDESSKKSDSGATDKSPEQSKGEQPKDAQPDGGQSGGSDAKGSDAKGSDPKSGEPGEKPDVTKPDKPAAGDKAEGDKAVGDKAAGDKAADDKAAGQQDMPRPGESKSGDPKSGDPKSGDPKSGDPKSGDPKSAEPKPGEGGKSSDPRPNEKQQKPPQSGTKPGDKKGGDADAKSKGPSGAGEKGGNEKGSPSPQDDNAPREKKQEPSGAGKPDSQDKPESPSISKKESDSKGGEDGDRAGGGGKGGGQPSKSQGTGSAGQNTAAEQGSGRANTQGDGETGDKGGDKGKGKSSDGAGEPSGDPGEGNKTQPGGSKPGAGADAAQKPMDRKPAAQEGDKPSSKDGGQQQPAKSGDQPQPPSIAGNKDAGDKDSGNKDPGGSAGNPTGGGGLPPDQVTPPNGKAAPNEQGEDEANLDYSRKATDLALEYLKDQMNKENPDKKLLEDLKWTREDAARFVARWEKMKRDAQAAGPQGEVAKKQLDDALEGLGLRPRGTALRGGQTSETRTPTVRDTRRGEPPPEYRQQFRAFTKGVAKGEDGKKPSGNK